MEAEILAIKFLGISLIILIIGIILFVLALLDCNTYIKYEADNKKIEVRAVNSNSLTNDVK